MNSKEYQPNDPFEYYVSVAMIFFIISLVIAGPVYYFADEIKANLNSPFVHGVYIGVQLIPIIFPIFYIVYFSICEYNYLSFIKNVVKQQWHDADAQLRRRSDLIPKFIDSIQGFLNHEQATFQSVAEARSQYVGSRTRKEQVGAASALTTALANLFVVVESNPAITSQPSVASLHAELVNTENLITEYRLSYNKHVNVFNTVCERFPTRFISSYLGFTKEPYL